MAEATAERDGETLRIRGELDFASVARLWETTRALFHAEPVRQALANLVDNAIRYTPEGGHIQVRIRILEEQVLVEVEDDGPGIDEEDRSRIFDRFYRAQPAKGGDTRGALKIGPPGPGRPGRRGRPGHR